MAKSSIGELFFKLLADTSDLASAKKAVDGFSDVTKKSADEINKAAAKVDTLAEKEKQAADEAKKLHKNAEKVVAAHKQAAKEAATLAEAEKIAADEANNIKKSFKGVGALIPTIVAGFASLQAVQAVRELATQAKELEHSAKALNTNVSVLSQYQYAFKQAKIDGDKVVDMFKDLNERVGEYANTGGGELADILKRTNLDINELITLAPDQKLLKIYDALEQIDGITQDEITAYLEQLVSDAALLQPLLADGAAELNRFREEGEALGVTLDQLEVDRLVAVDDELRQLTATWDGLTNDLIIAFAPALANAGKNLSSITGYMFGTKEEARELAKFVNLDRDSFDNLDAIIARTDGTMRAYIGQSAAQRAESRKSIETNIVHAKSLMAVANANAMAAYEKAEAIRANKGFDLLGTEERKAQKLSASVRQYSIDLKNARDYLSEMNKDKRALAKFDSDGVVFKTKPAPKPKQTFAQKTAATEAKKKAADEKARRTKADNDKKTAQGKRDKATATRNAQRSAAKKASDDKKAANEIKRDEEKKQRQSIRDANTLKRDQEKRQKLADAEQKAITASFDRVQADLLTKQEKENQAFAKSLTDLKAAEEAKIATLIPYNELRQRLEKEHQDALAIIKNDVENRDQAQSDIDNVVGGLEGFELEEENSQYASDLEALAVARELELETITSYDEIERAIEQAHQEELLKIKADADKRALDNQIKNYRMQTKGHQAALGGMLDILKASGAEQSGIYKAMFAASKAFAIAESIIKIQQGIANAASLPFPANLPAIGIVLSQTAGIISTIRGAQFEGRQYGGPTSPNTGYQVNETGVPEVYTQGGRDYLLTGSQRGKVTPLKDSKTASNNASGGTMRITVNVDGQQQEEIITSKDVEAIALDVVTRKAGEVVGQDFGNPNSKFSKSMGENSKLVRSL